MLVEAENEKQSIEESFRGDLKRLGRWLKDKRYVALIVCLWTAVLSSVIVWEYYSLYEKYPFLKGPGYAVAFAPTYSQYIPRLCTLDYIVVLAASVLAGFAIADIEDTLFGFLVSGILSTLISVAYSTFFIWYVLGFGSILGSGFITTMMWAALLNVFRMIFPLALLVTFLGSICGSFFRDLIQPSAQD
jgi:hypothetical protein